MHDIFSEILGAFLGSELKTADPAYIVVRELTAKEQAMNTELDTLVEEVNVIRDVLSKKLKVVDAKRTLLWDMIHSNSPDHANSSLKIDNNFLYSALKSDTEEDQ